MSRGLTLLELVIVVGILVAALLVGVPTIRHMLLAARMSSAVNALVHAVHLARQEAQRDQRDVAICRSLDGASCAPEGNWASGWLTFINLDRDDPPQVDPSEQVLHVLQRPPLPLIASNRRAYVLRPGTLRATNGTVVFCDERGRSEARAVIISYTGRPRVAERTAAGQPLTCPE